MTRFLLSLNDAVDTVFAAISEALPGETYVPRAPASRIVDVATALIGDRPIQTVVSGIRPGEKIHEIMVSEEEAHRTVQRGRWYAILSMLPEVCGDRAGSGVLRKEYSSNDDVLDLEGVRKLLKSRLLMPEDVTGREGELLR
jgi:UDP-glucose 4-epimerase